MAVSPSPVSNVRAGTADAMAKPSSIDRLPEEVREEIGRLRRQGRTIDEILQKLRELLPADQQPSRSAMGRHVKKIEVLGSRIRASREMANALVDRLGDGGENKLLRLNAELMQGVITNLLVSDDGEPVTLDPKDAAFLANALQRIATAQKTDADLVARIREEGRKELEAELKRKLDEAARNDGFDAEAAEEARRILGFA